MAKYDVLKSRKYGSGSLTSFNPPVDSARGLQSASIHITNISDFSNPRPEHCENLRSASVSPCLEECISPMAQDYLTPMKLVQLTQEPDLTRLTFLELTVNTTENSLGDFGRHLPNLSELRFNNSVVPCVRDLGTSLSVVKVLWMPCCTLKDLDGLSALPSIKELYLAFNKIEDISVVTMLSSLEVLDIESNDVSDMDQLGYLGLCMSLKAITLEGNPLASKILKDSGSESKYRDTIHKAIPSIEVLDDTSLLYDKRGVGENAVDTVTSTSSIVLNDRVMAKDWHILQQNIKRGVHWSTDTIQDSFRPTTAPASHSRSLSASPTPVVTSSDESSELTHGLSQVICGNPVRALRARKQQGLKSSSVIHHRPATTTPTSGYRLQDWKLDPVSEDVTITRSKSEERLFADDNLEQWAEPDQFSLSANTAQLRTPSPLTNNTHSPSTPELEHWPITNCQPTPPQVPPTPPGNTAYVSQSVASYRLRRFRKLSSEPVISDANPQQA